MYLLNQSDQRACPWTFFPRSSPGQMQPESNPLPSGPDQILCLDLTRAHLPILGALLNILYQLFFLILQLYALAVQLTLGLFKCSLMFAQPLLRCHALPEGPFDNLAIVVTWSSDCNGQLYRDLHS